MLIVVMQLAKEVTHKFAALDSLRGLAALMVVFQHFWEMNHASDDRLRPWWFFCAGHEAVIFFFVLSGFVLSNQLRNFKFTNYGQFILKRFFRIYPAYYVAILISAILLIFIKSYFPSALNGYGLTSWFYVWSQTAFDKTMILGSLSILYHEGNSLDVVTWSLFYEVWLSLVFPFILLVFWRLNFVVNLVATAVLVGLSYYFWAHGDLLGSSWQSLIYYSWYFLLGLLLFRCHEQLKFLANPWWLIFGILLYFSNFVFFGKISSRLLHEVIIALLFELIGQRQPGSVSLNGARRDRSEAGVARGVRHGGNPRMWGDPAAVKPGSHASPLSAWCQVVYSRQMCGRVDGGARLA